MLRYALPLLLLLSGCVSLSPQAKEVRVAEKDSEVANCDLLASVEAEPPFVGPNDAEKTLRNKTAAEGGDTLFITNMSIGPAKGQAYDCRSEDSE